MESQHICLIRVWVVRKVSCAWVVTNQEVGRRSANVCCNLSQAKHLRAGKMLALVERLGSHHAAGPTRPLTCSRAAHQRSPINSPSPIYIQSNPAKFRQGFGWANNVIARAQSQDTSVPPPSSPLPAMRHKMVRSVDIEEPKVVTRFIAETLLPTKHGKFRLRGYKHSVSGRAGRYTLHGKRVP